MKTEIKKSILSSMLALATLGATVLFWGNTTLLLILLFVTSLLMLAAERNKTALIVFLITFVAGPIAEALAVYFGAWSYAQPHFMGVPFWLPFLWGNAGLFIYRSGRFLDFLNNDSK